MTVAGQPQVTYTYANADRLTGIAQATATVSMAYDDASRHADAVFEHTATPGAFRKRSREAGAFTVAGSGDQIQLDP
jgi:hypothetical protein